MGCLVVYHSAAKQCICMLSFIWSDISVHVHNTVAQHTLAHHNAIACVAHLDRRGGGGGGIKRN